MNITREEFDSLIARVDKLEEILGQKKIEDRIRRSVAAVLREMSTDVLEPMEEDEFEEDEEKETVD